MKPTLLVSAVILLHVSTTAAEPFRAACVKVDITPSTPQWLHGYAPRKSEGVHDRIYHRIIALDDGETEFYLVASDMCTITPSFYHDVCQQLKQQTGIRQEQVWWTATHTHAAPTGSGTAVSEDAGRSVFYQA